MLLRVDPMAQAAPGDYCCRVDNGFLVIPEKFFLYTASHGLTKAVAVAGYAEAFPTSVARHFNWTVAQAKAATEGLYQTLASAGVVIDRASPSPRTHGFG